MLDLFKEILPSINRTKVPVVNETNSSDYKPWVVNKVFSLTLDTLHDAAIMNELSVLPADMQYTYYLKAVRPRNRYSPWLKPEAVSDDVKMIAEYYNISIRQAKDSLAVHTKAQLKTIAESLDKGGIRNGK